MAGNRTLKLSILADVDDLNKKLKAANSDVETSSDKISKFGKAAAAGFAIAGAAAIKFGIDFAKAAAEDQAAQEKLDATIRATTSATDAQVAAVGDWITKTSVAIGITDDQLRPAFSRLVRSTKDTEEAQRLLNLAMDLSSATGRPLEGVTNALARAYDGNYAALNKLGLGIDASAIKAKDFDGITKELAATYGSFAENEAETAAKKFERIKIATDEAKESIGAALLPVIEELSTFLLETFVPNLESFINALTGEGSLTEASENATEGAYKFGQEVRKVLKTIIDFKEELLIVGGIITTIFVASKIAAGVSATIALVRSLAAAYTALRNTALAAAIATRFAANPLLGLASAAAIAGAIYAASRIFDSSDARDNVESTGAIPFIGGFGTSASQTNIPSITTPSTTTTTTRPTTITGVNSAVAAAVTASNVVTGSFNAGTFRAAESASMAPVYNINVTGALDREAVARQIVTILNESSARGSGGASALQMA